MKMQATSLLLFPHSTFIIHSLFLIVLPLELQPLVVPRLAAVSPAPLLLLLLVTAQAGSQRDVDTGRRVESKALGHLDQVQLVHVKDSTQGMRRIGLEV